MNELDADLLEFNEAAAGLIGEWSIMICSIKLSNINFNFNLNCHIDE